MADIKEQGDLLDRVAPRNIEEEMKTSYINYAMSVIVGRALPDVRDGLKPVHRRILYTMDEMGLAHNKPYKKSARVVGDVMGKYHPHGDSAIYDAVVRMVQEFSLRHPLVDGQGNFGSIDADPPAAMRYTEVRLAGIAAEMLGDIDKNTVDFGPNYDGSLTEPLVLPAKLPNLLVNGSSGIAVGMATNIPPHNLLEVCDAAMAYIDNEEITNGELLKIMKGPDFPTAAIIAGREGIKNYFETGRGSITLRARTDIEEAKGGKQAIIVNELPYQVNKAQLLETIAELVRDKKMEGISDIRDESDRDGVRVVIELKRDANAQVVLNQLFKYTPMETSFGVILLALVDGKPRVLSMREMLKYYVEHRREVVVRRTRYELKRAEDRAHILEGLRIALDQLDKVIKTIRESKNVESARTALMERFELSRIQAQAILDMRLHQLTALERKALEDEYLDLIKTIARLKALLADAKMILAVIADELKEIKEKYGDKRRTQITGAAQEMELEDLIPQEDVVVTFSHAGYVKRLPVDTYRAQKRGGRGITGMTTKEEDFVEQLFVTDTHAHLLLFTTRGRVYGVRVYEIPEANRTSRGKAVVNLVALNPDEKVTSAIPVTSFDPGKTKHQSLVLCTRNGQIKRTALSEFDAIRKSGIIAIGLDEGDILVDAKLSIDKAEVLIGTKAGMCIRFGQEDVRLMGRGAGGVRGIRLDKDDQVVGMEVTTQGRNETLVTACELGFGKRTELSEYRDTSRGGKGVITIKTTDRNGPVIGIKLVTNTDDLMLMTEKGMAVRVHAKDLSVIGRNTQGYRLVRMEEGDKLAILAPVVADGDDDSAPAVN
ncbi:MAG: DNA gyrase subunit A [Elusimicrobia bacterium]|nr:DNA gyrase subunit A [Elusimicrobiota bacterium]